METYKTRLSVEFLRIEKQVLTNKVKMYLTTIKSKRLKQDVGNVNN